MGHALTAWELHRVEIRVATGNARSRAIPERLGFRREGTLRGAERHGERFLDLDVFALLAPSGAAHREVDCRAAASGRVASCPRSVVSRRASRSR